MSFAHVRVALGSRSRSLFSRREAFRWCIMSQGGVAAHETRGDLLVVPRLRSPASFGRRSAASASLLVRVHRARARCGESLRVVTAVSLSMPVPIQGDRQNQDSGQRDCQDAPGDAPQKRHAIVRDE